MTQPKSGLSQTNQSTKSPKKEEGFGQMGSSQTKGFTQTQGSLTTNPASLKGKLMSLEVRGVWGSE